MIDFHTCWIPSGLPDLAAGFGTDDPLPVHAGSIVDSLDRVEAVWVREGTANALLSPQ
jgi:hypothetical protein